MYRSVYKFSPIVAGVAFVVLAALAASSLRADGKSTMNSHTTNAFSGAKVNGGTVTHEMRDGRHVLTLSDDFKSPDTPAPHWQVVDSKGNVYLLNRLMIKGSVLGGERFNKSIKLPTYITDVARVQIWCAWAEALLGEASFSTPVM